MATEQLKAFLLKKSENVEGTIARWSARCDEYLLAVERLYDIIENVYLNFPDKAELLAIDRSRSLTVTVHGVRSLRLTV